MVQNNSNSVIKLFDNIVNYSDELVRIMRSSKMRNSDIAVIMDSIIAFMGEVIRIFPDMINENTAKTPLQRLHIAYREQKSAWQNFHANPALFYLEWYNFHLQWNNYYLNYEFTETSENAYFISLN